jgi:hypothetical protein
MENQNLLIDYFSIPAKRKHRTKHDYVFGERQAYIEKCGSEWVGYFKDEQGCEYVAGTKRDLITDMKQSA